MRRIRVQRGISLDDIARRTKVSVELWAGLERNDFSRWPAGIFARAYVREYANAVGIDPDTTVDDFCRWFSKGDRRAERIVRGQAQLVGHELQWNDDVPIADRRARVETPPPDAPPKPVRRTFAPRLRAAIALADVGIVGLCAALIAAVGPIGFWSALGIVAVAYHVCAIAALGSSPAVALVNWHVNAKRPAEAARDELGLRVLHGSERVKV